MKIIAIVLAAGSGNRFGSGPLPKQFIEFRGAPILAHTLINIQNVELINEIILVTKPENFEICSQIIDTYCSKKTTLVQGGDTRQKSIFLGLQAIEQSNFVVIQNSVCPFTSSSLIEKVIEKSIETGEAAGAYTDLKGGAIVRKQDNVITECLEISTLAQLQPPQVFPFEQLKACHLRAESEGILNVDTDSKLVNIYGYNMHLVLGSDRNIKITTQEDILIASTFFSKDSEG